MSRHTYGTMPPPGQTHAGSSRPSPQPSFQESKQIHWAGSDQRVTISVDYNQQKGPTVVFTNHDAYLRQNQCSNEGFQYELGPTQFTAISDTAQSALDYSACRTTNGQEIDLSTAESPVVIPANKPRTVFLNDGPKSESRARRYDTAENPLGLREQSVLDDMWKRADIQEYRFRPGDPSVSGERPCTAQWIFTHKPFPAQKDIEARGMEVPPVPHPYDGQFETRHRFGSSDHVKEVVVNDLHDWNWNHSWEIKDPNSRRMMKYTDDNLTPSPVELEASITVSVGHRQGEPRMRVRYNKASVRSIIENGVTGKAFLWPSPVRRSGWFPVDHLKTDDGQTVSLDDLLTAEKSLIPSNTARFWPSGPIEDLSWTQHHPGHGVYSQLKNQIESLGPHTTEMPMIEGRTTGLWQPTVEYKDGNRIIREKPIVLEYEYAYPEQARDVEDEDETYEEDNPLLAIAGVPSDASNSPPPAYEESDRSWLGEVLSCCLGTRS